MLRSDYSTSQNGLTRVRASAPQPGSQGQDMAVTVLYVQDMALTVLHVPCSLDKGCTGTRLTRVQTTVLSD